MKSVIFAAVAAVVAGCATAEKAEKKVEPAVEKPAAKPVYPVAPDTTGQRVWKMPFRLGLAGYTMHRKSLDETLQIMQALDLHYLCVKDFHLKYTASDAEIAAFKEKCAKYGVTGYGLGPLYTDSNEKVRDYFEFAKRFGAKTIVGVPFEQEVGKDGKKGGRIASRKQLEYIDKLVREFDVKYAIHNHGPQVAKMFPDVQFGYDMVKDLDKRIGFCMDVGWEFGCGRDPAATIRKYGERIYDIHLKNFAVDIAGGHKLAKAAQHSFTTVPMPRGKIDYGQVFKALAEVGYAGVCSFEYERDFENNFGGLAESVGYARGVCDTISVKARMQPAPKGANTLTAEEKAAGFELLFDGKTPPADKFVGVKGGCKAFPSKGWVVREPDVLTVLPTRGIQDGKWIDLPPEDAKLGGGGDIVTKKTYRDFHFKFDFRLTEAANSGIKYYYDETQNGGSCEEYQIMDKEHPDQHHGHNGDHRVASLYDVIPANADELVKGPGQWNHGEIIAKGNLVQHWLNGKKVVEYVRGGEAFRKGVANSKYAKWGKDKAGNPQPWGELAEGRILLQDHSDSTVGFCNLKVKEL